MSRDVDRATHNVAEYAVVDGLQELVQFGVKNFVKIDSQLLVRQLNGEYRVMMKVPSVFCAGEAFIAPLRKLSYCSPRSRAEQFADRLTNCGIDDAAK